MLYEIFPFPYAPLIATLLWSVVIGLVGHFAIFRLRFFDSLLKAPVSAVWQNISLARTSLVNEHTALARLASVPLGPAAAKQQMQAGLKRYLSAAIDDERAKRHDESASPEAGAALALHVQPYRGPDALTPGVLQEIRAKL